MLINTRHRIERNMPVTIGYFGGSITEGAGASDPDTTSWRALVTTWFREKYSRVEIKEVNAAIGGTGSSLGAFRCKEDLLCCNPDLIFVEFAVNDSGTEIEQISRSMEGIVRQIWYHNPEADIIFVYTGKEESFEDPEGKVRLSRTISTHQRIADHYGIPCVNVGEKLWEQVKENKGTWTELLPDGCHPSDEGYSIYADTVIEFVQNQLKMVNEQKYEGILPKPLNTRPFDRVKLHDAWSYEDNDWKKDEKSLDRRYPHMLVCNKPGEVLRFNFHGSVIGMYWLIAPDSGDIEWSIDGGNTEKVSSWDEWALKFTRANYCILRDDLGEGPHVLEIRILSEHNDESEGTWIRIGAFLAE